MSEGPSPSVSNGSSHQSAPLSAPKKLKKRIEGPRSRTGCGMCKTRKKKCDEVYDANGACGRCVKGKFICTPTSQRPSRARSVNSSTSQAPRAASSPEHSRTNSAFPLASTSILTSTSDGLPPPPLPRAGPSPGVPAPRPAPVEPVPDVLLQPFPFGDLGMPAFPYGDFNADLSLYDLLGAVDAGAGGLDFLPSLLGQPAVESFAAAAAPPDPVPQAAPVTGATETTMRDLEDAMGWEKGLLATGATGPDALEEVRNFAEQWWTFYRSLNESIFYSIPPVARNTVNDRMRDILMRPNNDAGRAAVSSWCSSHYSSVLLKEGSNQFDEWDAKAARYYQQCLFILYSPSITLWDRVGVLLDMRLAQINRHGAAPARFLELAGEAFIKQEMGDRPVINFALTARCEDLAMRIFAYHDVWRTVTSRGRRTLFILSDASDPLGIGMTEAETGPVNRRTLSVHLGLPIGLLLCFADIANLCVESATLSPQIVKQRGTELRSRIERWTPDTKLAMEAAIDSASMIADLAAQEMWRNAALVYLHSSVFGLGPLALPVRAALSQIVKLSSSLVEPAPDFPSVFIDASRCPIYFFASTVALTEDDREVCREGMLACGPGKAFVDNHKIVERLWREADETGVMPEWRGFLEREGLALCFLHPLDFAAVVDGRDFSVIRIDRMPTTAAPTAPTDPNARYKHHPDSEYAPEVMPGGLRHDLKPIHIS